MTKDGKFILKAEGVSKRFGGVQALQQVDFDLKYGEVHALVGENGAGKSTLIKVMSGVYPRDEGRIVFEGQEVIFHRPSEAKEVGIATIYQELSMLPSLNVIENIFTGRMTSRWGLINWKDLERRTLEALNIVGLDIDPHAIVRDLPLSQRQLIEIAKALSANARLIIMDEPNSSLADAETERLFEVITSLTAREIAIIYVSHKIEEVMEISDRITILRDGILIDTVQTAESSERAVINMMVGRDLDRSSRTVPSTTDELLLEVRGLTGRNFKDVSFSMQKGEIVAFAGLVGSGRTNVARAIFGSDPFESGEILYKGKSIRFNSTGAAIRAGLAMVQEDRKIMSLFMGLTAEQNITIAELPRLTRTAAIIDRRREKEISEHFVKSLDIRLESLETQVSSLSGGNQQKAVLARWLATNPKLLILDEPTHGVDVGAKAEIYELIRTLAQQGVGIILISSELPEILTMGHRIVVMHEGRVTGIISHEEATEDKLMAYATGLVDEFSTNDVVKQ